MNDDIGSNFDYFTATSLYNVIRDFKDTITNAGNTLGTASYKDLFTS